MAGRGCPRGWRSRRPRRGKGLEHEPAVVLCRLSRSACGAARAAHLATAGPGRAGRTGEQHPRCGAAGSWSARRPVRWISGHWRRARDRRRSCHVPESAAAPGADAQSGRFDHSDDATRHVCLLAGRPDGAVAGAGGGDRRPLGRNRPRGSARPPRKPGDAASLTTFHGQCDGPVYDLQSLIGRDTRRRVCCRPGPAHTQRRNRRCSAADSRARPRNCRPARARRCGNR